MGEEVRQNQCLRSVDGQCLRGPSPRVMVEEKVRERERDIERDRQRERRERKQAVAHACSRTLHVYPCS